MLASCFIIFIILLFKKWRFFGQRLVLYLAITSALLGLSFVLLRVDYQNQISTPYTNFCVWAGFVSQVTSWMVLDAIICITVSLLLRAFTGKHPERLEPLFFFLIFLFPLTFNWIPFIRLSYGKAGAWCWIRSRNDATCERHTLGQVLQLVLWYIPLYIIMLILVALYVIVLVKLHRDKQQWTGKVDPQSTKTKERMSKEILPLLAYPLIYFLLNIPPFINRIHGAVKPDNPAPALWFISGILFPLQGGVIALAFSLDPGTRKRLTPANFRAAFSELCRSKKRTIKEYPIPAEKELEKEPEKEGDVGSKEKEGELEGEESKCVSTTLGNESTVV